MKEIEIKILEINRPAVEAKLKSLGAKKIFDEKMHTLTYDFPDGSIAARKMLIRLRSEGKETVLTMKEPSAERKRIIREETEVVVSNFADTHKILTALGLLVKFDLLKKRTSYRLGSARFEFDRFLNDYSYIPEFLEVEVQQEKELEKYVQLLGFKMKDCTEMIFPDLVKYYRSKNVK